MDVDLEVESDPACAYALKAEGPFGNSVIHYVVDLVDVKKSKQ
jgi:hypothetical protein